MMVLGIDFGTKKVGLALLEATSTVISPLPVVKNDRHLFPHLVKIVSDYRVEIIVVGMPSYETTQKKVKRFVQNFELFLQKDLTIQYVNEDNTSLGIKSQINSPKQEKNLDSLSAVAILEQWQTETFNMTA